jgi:hypothetical protein
MIGRQEERAISAAVATARSGQPRIVLVGGEAGIGKTRLITEACARSEKDGVLCVIGGFVQLGGASTAYAPLIEALRGLRRRFGDEEFSELLGPATTSVGVLLGIGEGGSVEQSRLFEQLLGLIGRLAARQPLLIVLEDMHWSDASTRDLVAFLGRNLRDTPVALVLTFRNDELHRRHPWWTVLSSLEREPQAERLQLRGLGRTELADLLTQISDGPQLVEDLLHRSYAAAIRVEQRHIQSVVGRRAAGEELQHARQMVDELIGQARELVARFAADGIDVLPEPAAWLQTAEAEHAATRGNDTAQMWGDLADTWHRVGQPYRKPRRSTGKPTRCCASTATASRPDP